jgi:hypothetical protein
MGESVGFASLVEVGVVNFETYLMLLGAWMVLAITLGHFLKHRHKWHARAVDHGVMSEPRRNATAILYVCRSCGEAKSTTLAGTYQLEDIRGSDYDKAQRSDDPKSIRWSAHDKKFASTLKVTL